MIPRSKRYDLLTNNNIVAILRKKIDTLSYLQDKTVFFFQDLQTAVPRTKMILQQFNNYSTRVL